MENRQQSKPGKVVIVGAGAVGATFAYALAQSGLANEIVLNDRNRKLMEGQVMDLAHGQAFFPPVEIHCGEKRDYGDARIIVITAGAKQQPGESRLGLLQRNAEMIEGIMDDIVGQSSEAVVVVVSNPVDILTYVALKRSAWARGRVIGSGTVLDSARFRHLLSKHCGIDVRNVHAYILGEHGDSEFAAWSMTHLAGIPIDEYCHADEKHADWKQERLEIEKAVRDSAYHIIDHKGSTYFAIGLALVLIVGAILRNQKSVFTVSTLLKGEYGQEDVCLSVPCTISQKGVERIVMAKLSGEELDAMSKSGAVLRNALSALQKKG